MGDYTEVVEAERFDPVAAREYLSARYDGQCQLFPATVSIPKRLYVRRNVRWMREAWLSLREGV